MQRFIILRIAQALLAILVVSIIVFSLSHISGDPLTTIMPMGGVEPEDIEALRVKWGLDKPLHIQYAVFLKNAVRGDFGESYAFGGQTAMGMVMLRFPATLQLASVALLLTIAIGLPMGVLTAVKKDGFLDYQGKSIAFLGQSVPNFALGIGLMWFFAVWLGWL